MLTIVDFFHFNFSINITMIEKCNIRIFNLGEQKTNLFDYVKY